MLTYRESNDADIPGMSLLREEHWGTEDYWRKRITDYLRGDLHPQKALAPRIAYVAVIDEQVVGFIAGHLTQRFGCDGELEWINVKTEYRGRGVSSRLLALLATWFVNQKAKYICVDCAVDNAVAQKFYKRHGAVPLNEHWLIWKDISSTCI